jgi:sterol desaturase/sphingolipid hydroxylase (fatty acid hydroxylase superfamily)
MQPTECNFDPASVARGRAIKKWNAVTAALAGGVPAVVLALWNPPSPMTWALSFAGGLLWANAFEYAYHRWLLHWPSSYFGRGHLLHHASVGQSDEPDHVGLGGSPLAVLALFVANGTPLALLALVLHAAFAPGMMIAFAAYFMVVEEVHWRFHLGGWLPGVIARQRAIHLAHHDIPDANYAIFCRIFDRLLHTAR